MLEKIKCLFFDWGDTLMIDYPQYTGAMITWPQITPVHGVVDLLPWLAEKYACIVVSNAVESDALMMKQAFETVKIDKYFSLFLTSKELSAKKPDSEFYINALRIAGYNAAEVLMIGNDYFKDIVPAKEVGLTTILISQPEKEKDYIMADYIVNGFTGLGFLL